MIGGNCVLVFPFAINDKGRVSNKCFDFPFVRLTLDNKIRTRYIGVLKLPQQSFQLLSSTKNSTQRRSEDILAYTLVTDQCNHTFRFHCRFLKCVSDPAYHIVNNWFLVITEDF